MSVTVPTKVEFDALAAKVATLRADLDNLTSQHDRLVAEVVTDELRINALEALPPPVILPPPPSVVTDPLTVMDLAVVRATATSLVVRFTEVVDGTGLPAQYQLRYQAGVIGWGGAAVAPPILGTVIGAVRDVEIPGLLPSTAYQCQIVAYRGVLNTTAIFGPLSAVA